MARNPLKNIIARKMREANKFVMMTSYMEFGLAGLINENTWQVSPLRSKDHAGLLRRKGQRSLKWAKDAEAGEIATLKSTARPSSMK